MSTQKKRKPRPPAITVFFPHDASMQKQIIEDAKKIGISASSLVKMALEVGYPVVRDNFKRIAPLKK